MTSSREAYACSSCGRANGADALFCTACAAPLCCASCRARLEAGATFCSLCARPAGRRADLPAFDGPLGMPPARRVEVTAHLRIFVQTGSFADQQAPAVGQRLEALLTSLTTRLGIQPPQNPVSVFLAEVLRDPAREGESLAAGSYALPERGEVWSVYRSDAPGADLERTFVRLLLTLRTGRDPGGAPLILDGIVGLAAQSLGFFPDAPAVAQAIGGALQAGVQITLQPLLSGPSEEAAGLYPLVATSFVGFLLTQKRADALFALAGNLEPAGADAAFNSTYGQSLAALEKRWQQSLKRQAPNPAGIGSFLKTSLIYLKPYRHKEAEIILYILLAIAFGQALPQAQRYVIDHALVSGSTRTLFTMLGAGVVLFFLTAGTSLRQAYLGAQVGEGVMRDLRARLFARLQQLSASYFNTTATGDILSRMTNDLFVVEFALTGAILQGLVLCLTFVASLGSLLYLDWKLTLMALVVLPLFYLITRYLGPPASRASRERQEILGSVTGVMQENIAAQPVVRAYNLQPTFMREYGRQINNLYRSAIRLTFLGSLFGLSASLLTTLIQVLVFGIGGYFVIKHQLTLGALVAFLSLLGGLIAPAQSLSSVAQALQQASGAMDRITALLDEQPRIANRPDARAMPRLRESIVFKQVSFSYTGAEPQLADLSFTITAGSAVSFVGPSGSGKSTVTNLMLRFYDPDHGSVSFDGVDLRDLSLDSLRSQVGIVFQDNFLFNRSIRENIRFGRESASDAEVEAAARAAEVHEFIAQLPQGYDTVTGERGANLSGGQRQRLAIARAILHDPSLLILDEATSALDPRTENAINHTLASLARGRTTVSITHRLAAAATADRIFVLDRGRLVEQGTHAELLQHGGLYTRLYEEQSGSVSGSVLKLALELEYLRRVPVFSGLSADVLSSLASRLSSERVEEDGFAVRQGDLADKLYLLVSGEAEVLAQDATGNVRRLALLRPGDYFGEIALLYDVPRTASVRARTPLTLYALDRDAFLRLLESVPGLRRLIEGAIQAREIAAEPEAAVEAQPAVAAAAPEVMLDGSMFAGAGMITAPWAGRRPRLTVVGGDNQGRVFTLNEEFTGIGRHPANDIVLTERRVSGYHARIERRRDGRFVLTDSGSSNGTKVNGAPIRAAVELKAGDVLSLGGVELRYDAGR